MVQGEMDSTISNINNLISITKLYYNSKDNIYNKEIQS